MSLIMSRAVTGPPSLGGQVVSHISDLKKTLTGIKASSEEYNHTTRTDEKFCLLLSQLRRLQGLLLQLEHVCCCPSGLKQHSIVFV